MHAPPSLLRLLIIIFFVITASPLIARAADDPAGVGSVDKKENEAKVVSSESTTPAIIGTQAPIKLPVPLRPWRCTEYLHQSMRL